MSDNIIQFNGVSSLDISINQVLENAKEVHGQAEHVFIISVNNGKMRVSSDTSDMEIMALVIRSLKAEFLDAELLELE